MCPIKSGPHISPEQKAINTVVAENGHQQRPNTSDNSRKKNIPNNFLRPYHESIHEFTHCLTGEKKSLSDTQIFEKAKEFIAWARGPHVEELPLKSTFWRCQGIKEDTLFSWCKRIPDLQDLVDAGGEFCGDIRENILKPDFTHIRNRQNVYVPEYKRHDKEMIELRERIKHQIDKEEGLTPQQQQALFYSFMEPFLKDKKPDIDKKNDAGK